MRMIAAAEGLVDLRGDTFEPHLALYRRVCAR